MEDINFDELDDKTKLIISKMEKVIKSKKSEIQSKEKEIEDLKNQRFRNLKLKQLLIIEISQQLIKGKKIIYQI